MDSLAPNDDPGAPDFANPAHAVLAEVTCSWGDADDRATAVIVHAARGMLVLEAADPMRTLPPLGTEVQVTGETQQFRGRLAEHGRGGRFLISIGSRPVRRALRLRVSLPGTLRTPNQPSPVAVEIVDLTTGGCRLRGIELPVGTQVALDFTPPGRDQSVTVRALVAHGTHRAELPWVGLAFRLVALRGGR
jgi:hypothetical protein